MNVLEWLEFKLAYKDVTISQIGHQDMGAPTKLYNLKKVSSNTYNLQASIGTINEH